MNTVYIQRVVTPRLRFCQNSRHEREADEEDHSDLVYAAVIMPINLVNRS
jgi:hypothetical protein